jgi:alpha-tubulin suppressor-like RCC1 family protein
MLGRRSATKRTLAAALAVVAISGACRDKAVTGPTQTQGKDYAANLRSIGGDQQIGAVAVPLGQQLIVKVVDAGGQPVQGATVNFQVRGGGGTINPPANVSGADGLVKATWTLGSALGANKAVALLSSSFVLDSAVFTATATAGAPAIITVTGGNAQRSRVGLALGTPLSIKVVDQFGYNVSGAKVTWTAGANSGTVTAVKDTTLADGTASANWVLGTVAGPQTVTASVFGLTSVGFTATTTPDSVRILTRVGNAALSSGIGGSVPVTVKLTDQYGNVIVGDSVTFGDQIVGGGRVSPATVATDNLGQASTTWTFGQVGGVQSQRVRLTAAAGIRFDLTGTATLAFGEVVAGNFQSCAATAAGNRVFCWGAGDAGQLGRGNFASANAPTSAVPQAGDSLAGPFLQVRQLSAGRNAFCGLSTSRQMWCWGRYMAQPVSNVASFQSLSNGSPGQQILPAYIALGDQHTCLFDLGGFAFCTGANFHGELGNGGSSPSANTYTFVGAQSSPFDIWASMQAGATHTCAIPRFNAADSLNSRYPRCWGQNNEGQLGIGTFVDAQSPTKVLIGNVLGYATPTAFDSSTLAVGRNHTCAAEAFNFGAGSPGMAWCWGNNAYGQLGKGGAFNAGSRDSAMVPVAGAHVFVKLFAGEFHTCGIDTARQTWCWGRNDYGQLGDGTRTSSSTPVKVVAPSSFRTISIGELHTCAITGDVTAPGLPSAAVGTVYCWGDNSFGQLGTGDPVTGNAPVLTPKKVANQP